MACHRGDGPQGYLTLRRFIVPYVQKARTYGILALNLIELCQVIRPTGQRRTLRISPLQLPILKSCASSYNVLSSVMGRSRTRFPVAL
jgi:hypothetical protein